MTAGLQCLIIAEKQYAHGVQEPSSSLKTDELTSFVTKANLAIYQQNRGKQIKVITTSYVMLVRMLR